MADSSKSVVAILAAGASVRMGECKLLLPFGEATLLERAVQTALQSSADLTCVITGAYRDRMIPYLERYDLINIENPEWRKGQAFSVRVAANYAISIGADALILMVADQPFISPAHIDALLEANRRVDDSLVKAFSTTDGKSSGNPCLFRQLAFYELCGLEGDQGARSLLRNYAREQKRMVPSQDPRTFMDIDTIEDIAICEEMMRVA